MKTNFESLAAQLQSNHKYANGCWFTDYRKIPGLRVDASTCSGTSGLGRYKGRRVYWSQKGEKFIVELDKSP